MTEPKIQGWKFESVSNSGDDPKQEGFAWHVGFADAIKSVTDGVSSGAALRKIGALTLELDVARDDLREKSVAVGEAERKVRVLTLEKIDLDKRAIQAEAERDVWKEAARQAGVQIKHIARAASSQGKEVHIDLKKIDAELSEPKGKKKAAQNGGGTK